MLKKALSACVGVVFAAVEFVAVVCAEPVSELTGTARDEFGAASSRVGISATCLKHPSESFEGATDDAGRFRIVVAHDGLYRVQLRDRAGVGCSAVRVSGARSSGCTLRVTRPRGAITGSIYQRGAPQKGVIVAAFSQDELDKDELKPVQTTQTGPEGHFALSGLRHNESYVLHVIARGRLWPVGVVVTPPADGIEVVLPNPALLAGRVVDPSGEPVTTRFTVSCRDADIDDDTHTGGVEMVFQSRDGTFRLDDVRPGGWRCLVSAAGFAPYWFDVTLMEGEWNEHLAVRLRTGATLSGTVRAETGRPVAGAAASLAGVRSTSPSAITNAQGRYVFRDLDADSYLLTVQHPDYVSVGHTVNVHAPTTAADVILRGGRVVSGTVVVGETQAAAGGANVWLVARGDELTDPLVTRADQAGRFAFRHARPGRYTLRGMLAGASAAVNISVGTDEVAGVVLRLKARRLQGRVYGLSPGETIGITGTAPGFATETHTTGSGDFTLDGVLPGRMTVYATRVHTANRAAVERRVETIVPEDGNAPLLEIRFDTGCSVFGRLTRESAPVVGAAVVLVSPRTGNSMSARSDSGGEFHFEAVEEGAHELSVLDQRNSAPVRREIQACSSRPVDIDLPGVRLVGQVREKDTDETVPNAPVKLIVTDATTVTATEVITDGSGRFNFGGLQPDQRYTLVVGKSGFKTEQLDLDTRNVRGELVVRLQRGDGLWLRPFDVTTRTPVRSVLVRAVAASGHEVFLGGVSTDEQGVASLSLAPGRYLLRLHAPGYAPIVMRDVGVPGPVLPVAFSIGGDLRIRISAERIPVRADIVANGDEVPLAFEDSSGELWLRQPLTPIDHVAAGRYMLRLNEQTASNVPFEVRNGEVTLVDVP